MHLLFIAMVWFYNGVVYVVQIKFEHVLFFLYTGLVHSNPNTKVHEIKEICNICIDLNNKKRIGLGWYYGRLSVNLIYILIIEILYINIQLQFPKRPKSESNFYILLYVLYISTLVLT